MPDCVKTRERCNRKSVISVSLRHFLSDPRRRVTRPAPAGHATCARGSHDLRPRVTRPAPAGRWESRRKKRKHRTVKSHSKAPIRQLFFFWKRVIASCWWEEAEGRRLLGSLFHRSFERHNDVPLKCFFGEFFYEFLITSPAHSLAE